MATADPIKRFFEVQLPQMVLRSFFDHLQQEGTITFDVKDAGQWSFTFGSEEPIKPGLADKPGLALTFTRQAFLQLVDGTLDVTAAVQKKEVTVKGRDFLLFENFGRLLAPPATDLGWDARTTG